MPMAPRSDSAPAENNRRQPETGPLDAPQPVQPSSTPPASVSQPARTKRKRSQDSEAEADEPEGVHPSERPRRFSHPELSEENLQEDSVMEADKPEGVRYLEEPQVFPPLPPPIQPSPASPASIFQPAGTKQKRLQDPEAEAEADELEYVRPSKQHQELPPSELSEEILPKVSEAEAKTDEPEGVRPSEHPQGLSPLSEKDLHALYKEVMDFTANNARLGSIKRTSSRRSIAALSEAESFRSQRSSNTTAHYRYKHLKDANVYIHVDPPEDIQAAIDGIVNAELSEDCHTIPHNKAKKFWKKCKEMVQAAAGEDDFAHAFYTIAEEMGPDNLISREKADWRWELKPTIQQVDANLSFLSDFNAMGSDKQQEVDDISAPPPLKRHQRSAGRVYISPQNFQTNSFNAPPDNRPPEPDKAKKMSPIKTPRPDITTGIKESALISALISYLSSQNLNYNKAKAQKFLKCLQDTTMLSERDGLQEPALIIVPTQRESTLTFPTLGFEGKGYSTGKQVFEAQNQAAVLGACGVKIQMMLDELVKRATRSSDVSLTPSKNQPPLVFTICTEGPHHELWANYTVIEDGERQFNMVLLDTCYGVILEQVERFFARIYNIMIWTIGPFLETAADGLGKVIMKAGAGA